MSKFDKDLKVGDLICDGQKYVNRIIKVERRFLTQEMLDAAKGNTWYASQYAGMNVGDELPSIIFHKAAASNTTGKRINGKMIYFSPVSGTRLAISNIMANIQKEEELIVNLLKLTQTDVPSTLTQEEEERIADMKRRYRL
jgi:hypothetical protein